MEDVIFGGTDDRRPMGFAEVTVVFDNSDPENRLDSEYDEVSVTRRYYRTGESEYLINRQPKRLRDIYELFMNTGVGREGYSIIGQGKIQEIVSKKSEERRSIFEEAAGISKYRHRKEEAERKLKSTQENLDRVKDILSELESRVGPLEKEAERARKGLAIYEEKKRADVSLWLFDTEKIRDDIEEAQRLYLLSKHELEIIDQTIADLQAQNESVFEKSQSNKLESGRVLEQIRLTTEKLHNLDSALGVAESNFSHSNEMIEQCRSRIAEIEKSIESLRNNQAEHIGKASEIEGRMNALLDERLDKLAEHQNLTVKVESAKRELTEALDELTVEENAATDLKVRIDVLTSSKVSDGTKSADIEAEIEKYEKEGDSLKEEAKRAEKNASGFKTQIAEKETIIAEATARMEELAEEKEQVLSLLNSQKVERETLLQKADALARMNEHFEGYLESIKFVMREYQAGNIRDAGRIHGPLSSLIRVDKEYITAIETALGGSLQNIVVDDESTAKASINALKRANAGRATFYPISAIRPMSETPELRECQNLTGFVGRADTLVESDAAYRNIIQFLLLRTAVFDNIDNASVAAKKLRYHVKIVTLDGQVINTGGAFTGGSAKRDSGILSRLSDIASMRERAEALNKKIESGMEDIREIEDEYAAQKNRMLDATQDKELLLTLSRAQFSALDQANANYSANRNIVEKLRFDYHNLIGQQSRAEDELRSLGEDFAAAEERISALKSFRERRSEEMGVMDEMRDRLNSEANELFIKATELRGDAETARQMASALDERIGESESEKLLQESRIADLLARRENIDELKKENKEEYERLQEELTKLSEQRREMENGSDEFDQLLKQISLRLKEKNSSRDVSYEAALRAENRVDSLMEKQDKLGSALWDEYELTYEDAVALSYPPVTKENRDEIGAIQASCRSKLKNIGHYNPGAIEEYAEVKTRYDGLNTQYTDLTHSLDELNDIINRLELEMRESFINAFNEINRNFGITFRELFGGGNAELLMVDPDDVLTSGIEIKAAPPGKIIKSMSLLSGGEQSFVAIALLFAILKVNPTPFCILDEIEAALDEVNVFRFGEYIKKLADGTQFILITHRRGTMEVGDRLYGVTMPQRGISQAIELNVNEIEGKQKELLDGIL